MSEGTDPGLYQAMIDRRWGGQKPDHATRIEFQLSRACLRDFGIDSPSQFMKSIGTIVLELSFNWFRLTAEAVDRKNNHQSRALTHPVWEEIQGAFVKCFIDAFAEPLSPIHREQVDVKRLINPNVA